MTKIIDITDEEAYLSGFRKCLNCGEWVWALAHYSHTIPRRFWLTWYHSLTEFQRCDITKADVAVPDQLPLDLTLRFNAQYNMYRNESQRRGQANMNALGDIAPRFYDIVKNTYADCTYNDEYVPLFREWVLGEKR